MYSLGVSVDGNAVSSRRRQGRGRRVRESVCVFNRLDRVLVIGGSLASSHARLWSGVRQSVRSRVCEVRSEEWGEDAFVT